MARGRGKGKTQKRPSKAADSEPPTKLARCDSENTQLKKAITKVEDQASTSGTAPSCAKADNFLLIKLNLPVNTRVTGEFACMLNQTDVINNNNKFYVIQIVENAKQFHLFTRWGRVGENGQDKTESFKTLDEAIKGFHKKFQDKTGNKWENRENFTAKNKKYTLLAIETEDSDGDADDVDEIDSAVATIKKAPTKTSIEKCSLDYRTLIMVKLIFSSDMFSSSMTEMNLDIRKMPLGKLSKVQIAKGLAALIEIEEAVKNRESGDVVAQLSSKFFTLIPHNFGRNRPPVLNGESDIRTKKDVMMTLADIELTQSLQVAKDDAALDPMDIHYNSLCCDMKLLSKKSKEFKLICQFVMATAPKRTPLDIWSLDREPEAERYSVVDNIGNRKLLWHGTNVAVVAAILNSGLRIMPHSGGRLGRGIYLASEHSKSAAYTCGHSGMFEGEKDPAFMFLCEAALGREKDNLTGDGRLVAAPDGFDSVVGRGQHEPNPKQDSTLTLDGRAVTVPVGKPVNQDKYKNSNFDQSEYLVYRENQVRLRFLLKFAEFRSYY